MESATSAFSKSLSRATCVAIAAFALLPVFVEGSQLVITDMGFGVLVDHSGNRDDDATIGVVNPFQTTHHASLANGASASATYDFHWDRTSAQFLMQTSQIAPDVATGSLFSRTSGDIRFISSQDLLIDLSAFYTYQGLGSEFASVMSVRVVDHTLSPIFHYLNYGQNGGPVFLSPPSGTFSTSLQTLLPADHLIRVSYTFRLETYAGSSSAVGTANGGLQFTLTAVPEPSTALLFALGFGALILRKRRAR